MNVSYASAFLVARLAAFCIFNCVLGQLPFLMVLVLCPLTCSGGLVDSFSLVASLLGFTCQVVRGVGAFAPCLEHVRAGGGVV